jgi:peptidoglycan hydrolase-like protein with peptidoglycan-binding domain
VFTFVGSFIVLKKIVIAVSVAVVTFGGFGIAQASAKGEPEGTLMRPIDVRNCADSGVERGDKGHCVWILQTALDREGYKIDTDGRYGPKTQAMVAKFNQAEDICDGEGHYAKTATERTFERLADELKPSKYQKNNKHFHADHV